MKSFSCLYHTIIFCYTNTILINSTYTFIMKIPNKQELQRIAFNHSSDTDFQDFINLYKICTAKGYSFFVIDTAFAPDNH